MKEDFVVTKFWNLVDLIRINVLKDIIKSKTLFLGVDQFDLRINKLKISNFYNYKVNGFLEKHPFQKEVEYAIQDYYFFSDPKKIDRNRIKGIIDALELRRNISSQNESSIDDCFVALDKISLCEMTAEIYAITDLIKSLTFLKENWDNGQTAQKVIEKIIFKRIKNQIKILDDIDVDILVKEWTTPKLGNKTSLFDPKDSENLKALLTGNKINEKINCEGPSNELGTWFYEMFTQKMIDQRVKILKKDYFEWIINNFTCDNIPIKEAYFRGLLSKRDPVKAKRIIGFQLDKKKYLKK